MVESLNGPHRFSIFDSENAFLRALLRRTELLTQRSQTDPGLESRLQPATPRDLRQHHLAIVEGVARR